MLTLTETSNNQIIKTHNKIIQIGISALIGLSTLNISYGSYNITDIVFIKDSKTINDYGNNNFLRNENNIFKSKELLLAFTINNIPRNHVDLVLQRNNEIYLSEETFNKFNIKKPALTKIAYFDKKYYKLPQAQYSIKQATSTIEIIIPPEQFNKTIIEPDNIWHRVETPGNGAYLNYDLLYKYTKEPVVKQLDGLLNTTLFYGNNVLTSDFKVTLDNETNNKKITRLETKYIKDLPNSMLTLTAGDIRSFADLWGNPTLMGGFQLATNFTLQPGFIYYPLPDITGNASIPSAIDLYVNDTNRQRKNIQEGPFEILDIPIINGSGEIEVIEQDILGREKKYSVPYYLSSFSLKPDISQYSLSFGMLRNNFAESNDKYRDFAAVGNYRKGINNNFTYGLRGEFKEKQAGFGLRGTFSKEKYGELSFVSVGSIQNQVQSGVGGLFKLIYINQFKNKINFNITADVISRKYISLGDNPGDLPYRASLQTFVGIPFNYNNSLTLNYITRDNRNRKSQSLISANYFHNIKNFANITITSQYDFNNPERKVVFINLIKSFPKQSITTSLSSNIETDQKTRYIYDFNKSINDYTGYGYHFRASKKQNLDILADIKYNSQYNSLQLEYNHLSNEHNFRLSGRGGIAYFDKNIYITRSISDSFAVIDVNKLKNVSVFHNNRYITKTNNSGKAIIPQLSSYNINKISLNPQDLPITSSFNNTSIELIPYRNTGKKIKFDIHQHRSVKLKLLNNNLKKLETGTHITDSEDNLLTIVGFDSLVYLDISNEFQNKELYAHWIDGDCKFSLPNNVFNTSETTIELDKVVCN